MNKENPIVLYPSHWLYNASVIGFLKLMAFGGKEKEIEKEWLKDDGTVEIPRDKELFESWFELYWDYHKDYYEKEEDKKRGKKNKEKKEKKPPLYGKNNWYPNFIQGEDSLKDWVANLIHIQEVNTKCCGLCLRNFDINSNSLTENTKDYIKRRTEKFISSHIAYLAPAETRFPNALWNLDHSFFICPLCAYLIIHHHIPLWSTKIENHQIFVNANSFKVMWYLNKFAGRILSRENYKSIRKVLGLSLIEFSQRIHATLGAWSMSSVEVVIKKEIKGESKIDYYSLPYPIVSVLLNKEISKIINEINEPVVLDKILEGDFDYLLTIAHHSIRASYGEDKDYLSDALGISRNADLKKLARKLPELYAKIDSVIKGGIR